MVYQLENASFQATSDRCRCLGYKCRSVKTQNSQNEENNPSSTFRVVIGSIWPVEQTDSFALGSLDANPPCNVTLRRRSGYYCDDLTGFYLQLQSFFFLVVAVLVLLYEVLLSLVDHARAVDRELLLFEVFDLVEFEAVLGTR